MYKYIIYKVVHKLKKSKFLYGFMTLQFMVGFFILNIFLTISITSENDYTRMLKNGLDKEYGIIINLKNKDIFSPEKFNLLKWGKDKPTPNEYTNIPFDLEDISHIEEITGGSVKAEVKIFINYLSNETESKRYTLYYRNNVENISMSIKFTDISTKIKSKYALNPRDFPYIYDTLTQTLVSDITGYKMKVNINNMDDVEAILPLEWYLPVFHYKDINNMKLTISFQNIDNNQFSDLNQKMQDVKEYLTGKHEDYEYSIDNAFFDYMRQVNTLKENSIIFNLIAIIFFSIILIGLIGLFLLFMERRKKELAIGISLGARKIHLMCEVYLEILMIALSGYFLGVVISSVLLLKGFSYATVVVQFNYIISQILIIIPFAISFLAVLPTVYMIKKLEPMEILRNL